LIVVFGAQALVFALLPMSESWIFLVLEATAFGFAFGGATTLFAALVGDYYGPSAVGAIVGFVFAVAGSAAAFGPWLAGYVVDATGSYDLSFWLGAVSNGVACGLVFFLRTPVPPPAR
jgi:MFS family permease